MEPMGAATHYSTEVRILLCPGCGGPITVAPTGGLTRCRFCGAESELVGRAKLPAFLPPEPPRLSEAERQVVLRAQEDKPLLPPLGIASLIAPGGIIATHRRAEALAAWQSARKRTAAGSLEAAEELAFLTLVLGNELIATADWERHRAMLESALEAYFLPRHRSSVAANLCIGACRQGDVAGGEAWFALVDAASEDLAADSDYRIARARLSLTKGDLGGVIDALGRAAGDVPFHAANEAVASARRADAYEHMGDVGSAVRELSGEMLRGPSQRARVEHIVATHGLCPQALPRARAIAAARSAEAAANLATGGEERTGAIGKGLLVLGVVGIVGACFGLAEVQSGRGWEDTASCLGIIFGGGFGVVFFALGLLLAALGRRPAREADRARRIAFHGRAAEGEVLSVTDTGRMKGARSHVAIRLRVQVEGLAPYEAVTHMVVAPRQRPKVGSVIYLRVDPNDPSEVALDA